MKNQQKGSANVILIVLVILLAIAVVYFAFIKKASAPQVESTDMQASQSTNVSSTGSSLAPVSSTSSAITTPAVPPQTGWKTYTNTKYGFSFQYPDTWSQFGNEMDSGDLSGNIGIVTLDFNDRAPGSNEKTETTTTFEVQYHLAPNGAQLYQNQLSDFNASKNLYATGSKKLTVAGSTALEASNIWTTNGKGNPMPPVRSIIIDFLDKQQTGGFELQFTTPANANEAKETALLNQVLPTFTTTPVSYTTVTGELPSPYITAQQGWPLVVTHSTAAYSCTPGTNQSDETGKTTQKVINGRTYCVKSTSDGTAGSSYLTYTYMTPSSNGSGTQTTTFTLRYVDCGVYSDPQMSQCRDQQTNFDLDGNVDKAVQS